MNLTPAERHRQKMRAKAAARTAPLIHASPESTAFGAVAFSRWGASHPQPALPSSCKTPLGVAVLAIEAAIGKVAGISNEALEARGFSLQCAETDYLSGVETAAQMIKHVVRNLIGLMSGMPPVADVRGAMIARYGEAAALAFAQALAWAVAQEGAFP
jgi:hypothetical protein